MSHCFLSLLANIHSIQAFFSNYQLDLNSNFRLCPLPMSVSIIFSYSKSVHGKVNVVERNTRPRSGASAATIQIEPSRARRQSLRYIDMVELRGAHFGRCPGRGTSSKDLGDALCAGVGDVNPYVGLDPDVLSFLGCFVEGLHDP